MALGNASPARPALAARQPVTGATVTPDSRANHRSLAAACPAFHPLPVRVGHWPARIMPAVAPTASLPLQVPVTGVVANTPARQGAVHFECAPVAHTS